MVSYKSEIQSMTLKIYFRKPVLEMQIRKMVFFDKESLNLTVHYYGNKEFRFGLNEVKPPNQGIWIIIHEQREQWTSFATTHWWKPSSQNWRACGCSRISFYFFVEINFTTPRQIIIQKLSGYSTPLRYLAYAKIRIYFHVWCDFKEMRMVWMKRDKQTECVVNSTQNFSIYFLIYFKRFRNGYTVVFDEGVFFCRSV